VFCCVLQLKWRLRRLLQRFPSEPEILIENLLKLSQNPSLPWMKRKLAEKVKEKKKMEEI